MKIKLALILTASLLPFAHGSFGQEGEKLFKANCAACHTIGKGKLVGPDLLGVNDRHPESWSVKWIKSSMTMVQSGDAEAARLFKENDGMPMTDQPLSDPEIKSVLAFIKEKGAPVQAINPVAPENPTNVASVNTAEKMSQSPSILNQFSWSAYLFGGLFIFLIIVIIVLCSTLKLSAASRK